MEEKYFGREALEMKFVYIYCEGQTEEAFVNELLYPYFINQEICVTPIICETKRLPNKKFKGGVSNYEKIRKELNMLCKNQKNMLVTTMFDYYALPSDTPEITASHPDIYERAKCIEKAVNEDIGVENCRFHLMLHEFEGILFSNPDSFHMIADEQVVQRIQRIRYTYPSPEHINNAPETAPSKRIEALIPNYAKVKNGTLLSKDMGIDIIMEQCLHFRNWIQEIVAWGQNER